MTRARRAVGGWPDPAAIAARPLAGFEDVVTARVVDRLTEVFDCLSPSEQRVASLAATGRSNAQIAQALWITLSTVEQHLTATYRKLNVANRKGLREARRRALTEGGSDG